MRNLGLDVLRCVAVLLVILCHLRDVSCIPDGAINFIRAGGGLGVTLFFVLSGFLVSGLLFREHQLCDSVDTRRFLIRRSFKLYPPYWAWLSGSAMLSLPVLWAGSPREYWESLLVRLMFLQNYFPRYFDHTWTLAVEEQFYIVLAALVATCSGSGGSPFGWVPMVFFATAATSVVLRSGAFTMVTAFSPSAFVGTHYQADALFFGVMLSYLVHYHNLDHHIRRIPTALLAAAGVGIAASLSYVPGFSAMPGAPLGHVGAYLGAGAIVLAARRWSDSSSRLIGCIGFLGATSYSTYLWHGFVNILANRGPEKLIGHCDPWVYRVGYIGGAFVVGIAMHRLIELPAMRLRDRWFPSRTSQIAAVMGGISSVTCPP